MGKFALTVIILAATFCISCADAPATATAADLGQAATKLNQQSKTQLGVSIRSLGFLYEARPGVYSLKDAMVTDGSWPFLQELERAGLVKVSTVTGLPNGGEPSSEFVVVELTSKGVQVRDALGAP